MVPGELIPLATHTLCVRPAPPRPPLIDESTLTMLPSYQPYQMRLRSFRMYQMRLRSFRMDQIRDSKWSFRM
eukprot:scaffold38515_cov31-Phaeocystis_antarctica.AAC.1